MPLYVSFTMSNFEALYYVFEEASKEEALQRVFDLSEIEDTEVISLPVTATLEEKLEYVGVEMKEYVYDEAIFQASKKSVEKYRAIVRGEIEASDQLKDWVSTAYNITDEDMIVAKDALQHLDQYLNDETDSGLNIYSLLIDKYMDIFCLGEGTASSIELNIACENKLAEGEPT